MAPLFVNRGNGQFVRFGEPYFLRLRLALPHRPEGSPPPTRIEIGRLSGAVREGAPLPLGPGKPGRDRPLELMS